MFVKAVGKADQEIIESKELKKKEPFGGVTTHEVNDVRVLGGRMYKNMSKE